MHCMLVKIMPRNPDGTYQDLLLSTAPFNVELDGQEYVGAGDIISISDINNSTEINKTGVTIQISGIEPTFQQHLDNRGFVRVPIDILFAEVADGDNVVTTYSYYHRGYCDTPLTQIDYESGTLIISMETTNIFTDIDRVPDLMRCSMASHSSRHSGDRFFEFTADVNLEETWKA